MSPTSEEMGLVRSLPKINGSEVSTSPKIVWASLRWWPWKVTSEIGLHIL